MTADELRVAVEARFRAVNGDHPMTREDDAYVTEYYVPLEELAQSSGRDPADVRRLMLANRLPLPSYVRSDGAQMVASDLFALADQAGGVDRLPEWFATNFDDSAKAVAEWDAYLAGQYVCLLSVTPEQMKRKDELVDAIEAQLAEPDPDSRAWLERLHALVDDLDAIAPPFAPYDRLRFGGPVSRDRLIDETRRRYPNLKVAAEQPRSS
jgi:uncharacterized protein DUF6058